MIELLDLIIYKGLKFRYFPNRSLFIYILQVI